MTRKDYELLAETLRRAKPGSDYSISPVNPDTEAQWLSTCKLLAGALARENPRFNRDIFFTACGVA